MDAYADIIIQCHTQVLDEIQQFAWTMCQAVITGTMSHHPQVHARRMSTLQMWQPAEDANQHMHICSHMQTRAHLRLGLVCCCPGGQDAASRDLLPHMNSMQSDYTYTDLGPSQYVGFQECCTLPGGTAPAAAGGGGGWTDLPGSSAGGSSSSSGSCFAGLIKPLAPPATGPTLGLSRLHERRHLLLGRLQSQAHPHNALHMSWQDTQTP